MSFEGLQVWTTPQEKELGWDEDTGIFNTFMQTYFNKFVLVMDAVILLAIFYAAIRWSQGKRGK